jgi:uncharacterized membrane-anchored protein
MNLKKLSCLAFALIWTFSMATTLTDLDSLRWVKGPMNGDLGPDASINVPSGFQFLRPEDTAKLIEITHSDKVTTPAYSFRPINSPWVAVFQYDPTGYVLDDEKIDPTVLLQTLTKSTDAQNPERLKKGWPERHILKWLKEPVYDPSVHALNWSLLYREDSNNRVFATYSAVLLGKSGVVKVNMPDLPQELLDKSISELHASLLGFQFSQGQRYLDRTSAAKQLIDIVKDSWFWLLVLFGLAATAWDKYKTRFSSPEAAPTSHANSAEPNQNAPSPSTHKRNWWEVLGVSASATDDEISSAYKQAIRQYHPDKVATLGPEIRAVAETKSKEINEAYRAARGR